MLILNIEANYDSTTSFISTLEKLESIECIYHFCLSFYKDNTLSIFQPQWKMWDEKAKDLWVQEMSILNKFLETAIKDTSFSYLNSHLDKLTDIIGY